MKKQLLLAVALASLLPAAANAATAVNLVTPGAEYGGGQYTLGFQFNVSSAQSITALGVYDNNGDGLTSQAQIGLWTLGGTLLTSATIAAGGGTLDGLFRFVSINSFALTPGVDYVIGSFTTDLASSLGTGQGGTGSINPLVTIVRDRFSPFDSAFGFASDTDNSLGAWLGANFQFSATTGVPEPAAWAMMLAGFGLVGSAMRRRQKVAVTFA
jgi:hypothetical protein